MKVVFVNTKWNMIQIKHDMNFIPQIGVKIDLWYTPLPTIRDVVVLPSVDTLSKLEINETDIDAIVFVD
jgi:Iap family predicted aminopeptidase